MNNNFEKEKVSINQLIQDKTENYSIEGDCIVPDVKPDIMEILTTSGVISINKKEVLDGKIKVSGNVGVFVDYKGKDENEITVRAIKHTMEFSQIIQMENITSDMNGDINVKLIKVQAKIINERKINIKAELEYNIKVFKTSTIEYVNCKNDSEIQKMEKNINTCSIFGMGATKTNLNEKQNANVGDNISEILNVNTYYRNIETKISINKIMVKSDLLVKTVYITDDGRISVIKNVYQVMGFIDMEGINEEKTIIPRISTSNCTFNLNNNQICLDMEIYIETIAFESKSMNVIEDMYSTKNTLKLKKNKIQTTKNINIINGKYNWSSSKNINIGDGNIIDAESNLINKKITVEKEKIKICMDVETKLLIMKNGISSQKQVESIEFYVDSKEATQESIINADFCISNENYNILLGGNVELKLDIDYIMEINNIAEIELINEVTIDKKNQCNPYNMIIYFTSSSDTLWEISKKFKTTEKKIIEDNKLATNQIKPGMKLFITK